MHQLHIEKREGGEGVRVWVDDLDGLLGLIEMDAVELHPWAASVEDIEHPDRLVFDLDPGPGVSWDFVTGTAFAVRTLLEADGHESWPKLTGGKGLHLMVPIEPGTSHDQARDYCRRIAEAIARTAPERYATSPDPKLRTGRIYIDTCAMAAATRRSGLTRRAPSRAFRSPRRSLGAKSSAAFCRTRSRLRAFRLCRAQGGAEQRFCRSLARWSESESLFALLHVNRSGS